MADYYLHKHTNLALHCEAAIMAQQAYRQADAYLQDMGIEDNLERQQTIHLAEQLL